MLNLGVPVLMADTGVVVLPDGVRSQKITTAARFEFNDGIGHFTHIRVKDDSEFNTNKAACGELLHQHGLCVDFLNADDR